jgi:hypothetical protein
MSTPRSTRVRARRNRITYLPGDSVGVREDEILARLWGCKPGTAHQWKLVINHRCADVIRVRRERGADESAATYAIPIEVALAHTPVVSQAELRADLADAREDEIQAIYRDNKTSQNAQKLLRARALERQTSLDADREIAVRHGLTL